MAKVKAFKAIRPSAEYQNVIPALPYDVYNREEARAYVDTHPHSFLAIDRPETQFSLDFDMYSKACYEKAASMINEWLDEGNFVYEDKPCYYVYEMTWAGKTQTGIVLCASVDDYLCGVIKKHENTRAQKEQDRIKHVYTCKTQTGPIFLCYKKNDTLRHAIELAKSGQPLYDFKYDNNVKNRVWRVDNDEQIGAISKAFDDVEALYIADGHHRCASAVKVAQRLREENPKYTGNEEFNWFLSVCFEADELSILDYNRVIKSLNGLSMHEFKAKLLQVFEFVKVSREKIKPQQKGDFGLFDGKCWTLLRVKDQFKSKDPVEGLDVSILQKCVLNGILEISDPTIDNRVDFVGGIRGLDELERRVREDCAAALAMYPTSMNELLAVADAGRLMPPKSTWFEPKLLSGLFLHPCDTESDSLSHL